MNNPTFTSTHIAKSHQPIVFQIQIRQKEQVARDVSISNSYFRAHLTKLYTSISKTKKHLKHQPENKLFIILFSFTAFQNSFIKINFIHLFFHFHSNYFILFHQTIKTFQASTMHHPKNKK